MQQTHFRPHHRPAAHPDPVRDISALRPRRDVLPAAQRLDAGPTGAGCDPGDNFLAKLVGRHLLLLQLHAVPQPADVHGFGYLKRSGSMSLSAVIVAWLTLVPTMVICRVSYISATNSNIAWRNAAGTISRLAYPATKRTVTAAAWRNVTDGHVCDPT